MNKQLLQKHIKTFITKSKKFEFGLDKFDEDRRERVKYYQSWTSEKIEKMSKEDFTEYVSKLWAMLIWGNKQYYVDKIISDNGFKYFKKQLTNLLWGTENIKIRWDSIRSKTKGMGPAMLSELLCHTHPEKYIIWNRRAFVGLTYLGVTDLPRYSYQLTGKVYSSLSHILQEIVEELKKAGIENANLLTADYFIWEELQVADNLTEALKTVKKDIPVKEDVKASDFIHNDVKDAIADIGNWLGLKASTEIKVADGSKVDVVWESTIGNMGRVIYVFEVQTKGSKDSLIINLFKALNNPAVQGVVAVSDSKQLDIIRKHAANVGDLGKKLKYWDYKNVLQVRESLEFVNQSINELELVPVGF